MQLIAQNTFHSACDNMDIKQIILESKHIQPDTQGVEQVCLAPPVCEFSAGSRTSKHVLFHCIHMAYELNAYVYQGERHWQ